jgi:ankyrin repeat protein
VKLLTQLPGIDVNKESSYGLFSAKEKKATAKNKTPLYCAAANGHTEVVKLLAAHPKIDINKKTWDGRTPMAAANKEEIKTILRDKGGK